MNRAAGFTLIEVVLAACMLVILLLGVATMSLTAQSHLSCAAEQTAATTLVQQRIEWLRNQGVASTELTAGTTTETLSGDYPGFKRTTIVQDDTPVPGLKRVSVTTQTPRGLAVTAVSLIGP